MALVGMAALARVAVDPLVGPVAPFGLFVPAVVLATWFAGTDAGVLTTIVAAFAGKFLFVEPRYHLAFNLRDGAVVLMALVVGFGLVLVVRTWRQTQVRLQDLREEIAGILRELPTGVVVADRAGRVVFANTEIERLLGQPLRLGALAEFRRQYTPRRPDGSLVDLADSPLLRAARGEDVPAEEAEIVRRDGARRIVRVCGTPVRRHDGMVVGGAVTVVDITELRETARVAREQAEELSAMLTERQHMEGKLRDQAEELERANRVKDEFLATLGHELRTPLAAIVGWAGMLLGGQLSKVATQKAHGAIARNAETLRVLIEDVLDVSRIVSGKLRLEMGQTDVVGPLRNALDAVRPAAEEKNLAVGVTLADEATSVWGDTGRLQQVFLNLLSNAIKFTPGGGRVEVKTRRVGGTVEVSVSDNGVGIPAEVLPHVFERFRQSDSSTTRPQTGLGLGLAIVKHLVELHGGTVEAASGGIGQGASFTVRLPYHPLEERRHVRAGELRRETLPLEPVGTTTASLCGVKVLIVDDQADTRELTASVLAQSGAKVHTSATAKEALRQLDSDRPQVLVVDISMPGMDGYAFVKAVRERNDGARQTPAIAFTAYAREEDRELALTSGFQMHLAKPVQPGDLVRAVASVAGVEDGSGDQ